MGVGVDSKSAMAEDMLRLSADIVSAYVTRNAVSADTLPELIRTVHRALAKVATPRDAELWLDIRMQEQLGDPAPAATVARRFGISPDAARQQKRRVEQCSTSTPASPRIVVIFCSSPGSPAILAP